MLSAAIVRELTNRVKIPRLRVHAFKTLCALILPIRDEPGQVGPSVPRLSQLVARNLGCSRADAVRLIEAGRAADQAGRLFNGARTTLDGDGPWTVRVDGVPVQLHDVYHLLQHKPAGVVTALRDPVHSTAYQLLRAAPLFRELRPVGRLDLDSTGVLLWTTSGDWVHRLTHPKHAVPRTYHVALARPFRPPPDHGDLVLDDGHHPRIAALATLSSADVHPAALPAPAGTVVWAAITIVGGAYHEVRRIFAALGSHVLGLCRVAFGDFILPTDLPPGAWRAESGDAGQRGRR